METLTISISVLKRTKRGFSQVFASKILIQGFKSLKCYPNLMGLFYSQQLKYRITYPKGVMLDGKFRLILALEMEAAWVIKAAAMD